MMFSTKTFRLETTAVSLEWQLSLWNGSILYFLRSKTLMAFKQGENNARFPEFFFIVPYVLKP